MSNLVYFKEYKYEKSYINFYSKMDFETVNDLIGFSRQQGDFNKKTDSFEKARLRALVAVAIKKSSDADYCAFLKNLIGYIEV